MRLNEGLFLSNLLSQGWNGEKREEKLPIPVDEAHFDVHEDTLDG